MVSLIGSASRTRKKFDASAVRIDDRHVDVGLDRPVGVGEEYLARIPARNHRALPELRDAHLRFTRTALRKLNEPDDDNSHDRQSVHKMNELNCH